MYEETQKREELQMKFMAAIHGINLDEQNESLIAPASSEIAGTKKQSGGFMFKAPGAYSNMTQEEKERETQRMKGMHKQWALNKAKVMGT